MGQETYSCPDRENLKVEYENELDVVEDLMDESTLCSNFNHLVLTGHQSHRYNLFERLRKRGYYQTHYRGERPIDVARQIVGVAGKKTETLSIDDRLELTREAIIEARREGEEWVKSLQIALTTNLNNNIETVDKVRSRIDLLTGYDCSRLDALKKIAEKLDGPHESDVLDLLKGSIGLVDALQERTEKHICNEDVYRAATHSLMDKEVLWSQAYPETDTVTLAGMSTLSIPLIELMGAVAASEDVKVRVVLRPGTAHLHRDRLSTIGTATSVSEVMG